MYELVVSGKAFRPHSQDNTTPLAQRFEGRRLVFAKLMPQTLSMAVAGFVRGRFVVYRSEFIPLHAQDGKDVNPALLLKAWCRSQGVEHLALLASPNTGSAEKINSVFAGSDRELARALSESSEEVIMQPADARERYFVVPNPTGISSSIRFAFRVEDIEMAEKFADTAELQLVRLHEPVAAGVFVLMRNKLDLLTADQNGASGQQTILVVVDERRVFLSWFYRNDWEQISYSVHNAAPADLAKELPQRMVDYISLGVSSAASARILLLNCSDCDLRSLGNVMHECLSGRGLHVDVTHVQLSEGVSNYLEVLSYG